MTLGRILNRNRTDFFDDGLKAPEADLRANNQIALNRKLGKTKTQRLETLESGVRHVELLLVHTNANPLHVRIADGFLRLVDNKLAHVVIVAALFSRALHGVGPAHLNSHLNLLDVWLCCPQNGTADALKSAIWDVVKSLNADYRGQVTHGGNYENC